MDAWAKLMGAGAGPIDPYLVWAVLTHFRDYALNGQQRGIAIAIECKTNVEDLQQAAKWLSIPKLYTDDRVVTAKCARYCTAIVSVEQLFRLLPLVKRLELGTAIRTQAQLFFDVVPEPWNPEVVVGVIDDFVAFGNACFCGDGDTSRVRYVWSQEALVPRKEPGTQWYEPKDAGYGYELSSLARIKPPIPAPTLEQLRDAYPAVLLRATHGTHVAHIAAGHDRGAGGLGRCNKDIIAVHLPRRMLADSSGGALSVQALDGLRYIMHRAGAQARVVVNMSYGTMAGPHDGSSILEEAIDQLIDLREGSLAVIVPAGNAYEDRCHASVCLSKTHRRATLNWNVLPDDATPSFLEIWLPEMEHISAHVSVRVRGPSGADVSVAKAPAAAFDNTAHPEQSSVAIVYWPRVANGNTGTMILVALAATHANDAHAPLAAHGVWRVELTYSGEETGVLIRAWVERDDKVHGQPRAGRQSYLIDEAYEMPNQQPAPPRDCDDSRVKRHGALNTIGTGSNTIVVGGYVGGTGKFAPYSGAGPTRTVRSGPDILAQTEECVTLHGLRAAAVEGLDSVRLNGTSVAVPQIVRRVSDWYAEVVGGAKRKLRPDEIRERLACEAATYPEEPPLPHDPCREGAGRVLPLGLCGAGPLPVGRTLVPAAPSAAEEVVVAGLRHGD